MNNRELLMSGAAELGIALLPAQLDAFLLYAAELRKWNRKINLTSITDERDVIVKHFLDSLAYFKGFTTAANVRLLDMGSGAGFPGIPLKIACPELEITLVESVKKKAAFLRHIIRTIALAQVEVRDVRIEELPDSLQKSYDVVTARAFADIETAAVFGAPFLKTGGCLVLSRGGEEEAEEPVLSRIGFVCKTKHSLTIPHSDFRRVIWLLEKK